MVTPLNLYEQKYQNVHFYMKYQIFLDVHKQFDLIVLEICYYAHFQCRKYSVRQFTI